MTELLPCPFCGGTAAMEGLLGGIAVACDDCMASTVGCSDGLEAQRLWNTRPKRTVPGDYPVLYFGCGNDRGHYLWTSGGRWVPPDVRPQIPWPVLDGALCPIFKKPGERSCRETQPEGRAALRYKEGWTALAFWDRSVDPRGGCNSVFLFPEMLTFSKAIEKVKEHFPKIWARFQFPVVLHETVNDDLKPVESDLSRISKALKPAFEELAERMGKDKS